MTSPADVERGVDANSDYEYWCARTSIYDISHATKAFYAGWRARDLLVERLRQREAAVQEIHAEQIRELAGARDWWRRRWERAVDALPAECVWPRCACPSEIQCGASVQKGEAR